MSIDETSLVDMLEFLVDNIYVVVGNKVGNMETQSCMHCLGTDCAPVLANLFLFYYEYSFMKTLMKNNIRLAKKFNNKVRYIDDLLTLNNPSFLDEIPNIYPRLKKTTESAVEVSYLDVKIGIEDERFVTSVYDKRDSFNF